MASPKGNSGQEDADRGEEPGFAEQIAEPKSNAGPLKPEVIAQEPEGNMDWIEALRRMAFPEGGSATQKVADAANSPPDEESFETQALRLLEEEVERETQRMALNEPAEGDPESPDGESLIAFLRQMAPPGKLPEPAKGKDQVSETSPPEGTANNPYVDALKKLAFPEAGVVGSPPDEDGFEAQALRWLEQEAARMARGEASPPEDTDDPYMDALKKLAFPEGSPSNAPSGETDFEAQALRWVERETARMARGEASPPEGMDDNPYVAALKKLAFPEGGPSNAPSGETDFEAQALRWVEREAARVARGEASPPESTDDNPYVAALKKLAFPEGGPLGSPPDEDGFEAQTQRSVEQEAARMARGEASPPEGTDDNPYVAALKKLAFPFPAGMARQGIGTGESPAAEEGFETDAMRWLEQEAKELWEGKEIQEEDPWVGAMKAVIKRLEGGQPAEAKPPKATIIAWSSDLDRAYTALILATTAAAAGMKVTVFATFWGLLLLKKSDRGVTGTDWMTRMLARMAPGGPDRLRLSKFNLGGFGIRIIKELFRQSRIMPLQTFLWMAIDLGVRFIPCQMTMDAFGLKREDLIDEVEEPAGAATAIAEAAESSINWFI